MRVLVISHTYISPINRDKWKVLAVSQPDLTLMVVFPKHWPTCLFTHQAEILPEEQTNNCTFVALDTIKQGNELLYRYEHKQLYQLVQQFKPDLIHVEQGGGALSYLQANLYTKWLYPKAKSVFFTWLNWKPQWSVKHQILLTPLERVNLSYAHGAIVGNHDAKKILERKGFDKPVLVLPQLGISTSIFKPQENIHRPTNLHYIAYIGRITEEKGIFDVAHAFVKLCHEFPEWNLLFAGKGPAYNKLRSFIARHRMTNRIHISNPVSHENVAKLLNNIDILVLPSHDTPTWREQFGHILIEAMGCKVPIIGSDAGEIPHVIGSSGLIFQQQNQHALLEQLKTLMQDETLRKKMGELGYQRVHEHYSHESIAQKTYTFWQQLVG